MPVPENRRPPHRMSGGTGRIKERRQAIMADLADDAEAGGLTDKKNQCPGPRDRVTAEMKRMKARWARKNKETV